MSLSNQTYLVYDTETTGLNQCFDQIMQFAAIRTDLAFNEIERHEFLVRLNPDAIPSPEAILIHRISPSLCRQAELTEYAAIQKIHHLFNEPGTISLGYNTLGFDDALLRFGFYRNLLTPYTHQYANGCSRMDLYPITAAFALFQPDCLIWPTINGKPTLRLEHLSSANQLTHGQAHHAMVDVEATIALAKKLSTHNKTWDYLTGFFNKQIDNQRIEQIPRHACGQRYAFLFNGKFGVEQQFQKPALLLGPHQHYRNQTVWLHLDQMTLTDLTVSELNEKTFTTFRKPADTYFILPPKPRFAQRLNPTRLALTHKNLDHLTQYPEILKQLQRYHCRYTYPEVPNIDIDAALYSRPFPDDATSHLLNQFHLAKNTDKKAFLKHFIDPGYRELTQRLLARNFPDLLSPEEREQFLTECFEERVDYRNQRRINVQEALIRCEDCEKNDLDSEQQKLLAELRDYLYLAQHKQLTVPRTT
ncbi:MAG: hypothetical protein A3F17_07075 [Gammaproteobacteria bacterium RIFCSPHIGHO2_12_FULL_41_15]|nr:MAG: hypothetical protein A3F17_07075 [Gammaproteobacteria bacterium RIFCSPHIGHO2_12_FULL_41_15]